MKYKFHDEKVLHRIKPWVYLSTYILLLAFFLMHVQDVVNGFDFVLSLFRSLLYAIVFAYVLNLPMKKIESFIIRHTKETSLLRKRKRMVSMFLTFLIAFLLLIIIGSIILPSIIGSLISLMQNLSSFFTDIVKNIDEILKYFHIDYRIEDIQQVEQFIQMPWEKIVSNAIAFLSGSASGILSSASNFISSFAVGFTGFMFSL
ncbi:MAG: AI-2E family transporter, partial [Longicatena caecimuris]